MGILSGVILGVVYAASPGPLTVETLRRGTRGGFLDSLAVQTGSSVGRIIYALLAFFSAGMLVQIDTLRLVTGVSGMTVMVYLGIAAIRQRCELVDQAGRPTAEGGSARGAFWAGAVLSLASPMAIAFWLSIGNSLLQDSTQIGPVFLSGFFLGCVIASLLVSLFASFWQARLSSRLVVIVSWTCGLALIGFGVKLGLSVSQYLIVW